MPQLTSEEAPRRVTRPRPTGKVRPLEEVARCVAKAKAKGKRVVHCHGVFDLLHPGHIRHLEAARREGDLLVVTVTQDEYVNKGPGRPVFNQRLRAESLAALECVDYVAVNQWPSAVETIRFLRPDVYVKGGEYAQREQDVTGKIVEEEHAVLAVGGRIHFTNEITFSSSKLLNDHFSVFLPETEAWLKAFRRRYTPEQVLGFLERASTLRPVVVGEAIIDEYAFCDGLGKSTKEPILAFRYGFTESHAGGSLAVANHLAGFCREVELVCLLGEHDRREDFVRQQLLPNVRLRVVTHRGAPTIHKRRFVDTHTAGRMFELYVMDDTPLDREAEAELLSSLNGATDGADLVIVADYGHGMLTPSAIRALCDFPRFLAVNTQANAGNRGFNTISRYRRADYVCLAGHEIALETRMRPGNLQDLILEVTKRINCPRFTVTHGGKGSLHYEAGVGFTEAPALASRITDRVGAGDAVLAVSSLLVAQGTPWDVVGLIGNVVGAEMVAELGNRVSVSRFPLTKHVTALLK